MSHTTAGQWVKFFNASGIPSPAAASYAHIFVENRIQIDMLMDLNKEYLREMGITLMGDIIAILRHAKSVNDQTAREKVLSSEVLVPIAAVPASPVVLQRKTDKSPSQVYPKSTSSKSHSLRKEAIREIPLTGHAETRRISPERESKYKVRLSSGTSSQTKDSLAKKTNLYADRELTNKETIFHRLSATDSTVVKFTALRDEDEGGNPSRGNGNSVQNRLSGIKTKANRTPSIFSRLGGKTDEDDVSVAKRIKPILKNAVKNSHSSITKSKALTAPIRSGNQKVILVKKVPLKDEGEISDDEDDSSHDDDYEMDMGNDGGRNEKTVQFYPTAEVREIAPTHFNSPQRQRGFKNGNKPGGFKAVSSIRSRLGAATKLQSIKKSYNVTSPVKSKTIRLKSDELLTSQNVPVHKRLGRSGLTGNSHFGAEKSPISLLSNRMGKVNLSTKSSSYKQSPSAHTSPPASAQHKIKHTTSVFDRLGFNN